MFKEVSKNGYFCTNADIKKEISIFKKAHEKNEYIKSKQNNEIKKNVEYIPLNDIGISNLDLIKIRNYSYSDLINIFMKTPSSLESITLQCLNSEQILKKCKQKLRKFKNLLLIKVKMGRWKFKFYYVEIINCY